MARRKSSKRSKAKGCSRHAGSNVAIPSESPSCVIVMPWLLRSFASCRQKSTDAILCVPGHAFRSREGDFSPSENVEALNSWIADNPPGDRRTAVTIRRYRRSQTSPGCYPQIEITLLCDSMHGNALRQGRP